MNEWIAEPILRIGAVRWLIAAALVVVLATLQLPGLAQSASDDPLVRVAFLARADNPVDALAASSVAGTMGGAVLLTSSDTLNEVTRQALIALDPDLVVLAGGTAALSPAVEQAVEAIPFDTQRISGASRLDTAAALSSLAADLGFDRPIVTGATVDGDAGLSGTLSVGDLEVANSDQVANLNASQLEGFGAADFLQSAERLDLAFPAVVPAAHTVFGRYGFDVDTDGTGDWGTSIEYPVPMPESLTPEFLDSGDDPTENCPGTAAEPAAVPGFLCLYAITQVNLSDGMNFLGNTPFGVNAYTTTGGSAGDAYGHGTWAATAPEEGEAAAATLQAPTTKE